MKKVFAGLAMTALLTGGMSAFSTAYADEKKKCALASVPVKPIVEKACGKSDK